MRGPTLPIAVLVRLHLIEVGVLAYERRHVHGVLFLAIGAGHEQRFKTRMVKGVLTVSSTCQIGSFMKQLVSLFFVVDLIEISKLHKFPKLLGQFWEPLINGTLCLVKS
jgi:hypothetical protein